MFGSGEAARSPRGVTSPDDSPRDPEKPSGARARGGGAPATTASVDELREWITKVESAAESAADARWGGRVGARASANPWGADPVLFELRRAAHRGAANCQLPNPSTVSVKNVG